MASALPQKEQSKNINNLTIDTNEKKSEQGETEMSKESRELTHARKELLKNDTENTSVQPTPTPSSGSDNNTNPLGGFKVPKKKIGSEAKSSGSVNESNNVPRLSSSDNAQPAGGPSKLNKNVITNLNKSLKAKQKIINSKEPHPKNSNIISEIINNSPKGTTFPGNISSSINDNENENNAYGAQGSGTNSSGNINNPSNANVNELNKLTIKKDKNKRIAKQNSTRTDFFAAKLASAVDDVDSSDSDETFVYENNSNDYEKNSSHNPNRIAQSDTASINGSIINSGGIVTNLNSPPILEENLDGGNAFATESIHSVHSSKIPTIRSTNNSIQPSETPNVNTLSDLFRTRPQQQRTGSTYSIPHLPPVIQNNEDRLHHPDAAMKNNTISSGQSPASPYALPNKVSSNQGILSSDKLLNYSGTNEQAYTTAASINDGYNEDRYSYDEVDDTDIIDDSADDEFYSSHRMNDSSHQSQNNTLTGYPVSNVANHEHSKVESVHNNKHIPSLTSKSTSKKISKSSTSSKLRSTTSKLFDKKGSQPRRYSIIPDDIDIEDFDDELIYYDNNIRFPYNSNNNPSSNTVNFSDATPLQNHNHRIPHYRSLNLNFLGKRNPNIKNKRYLSTGQPIIPNNDNEISTPPNTATNKHPNSDIFPFPYPEPHQKYYCDVDEYDEESPLNDFQDEEAQYRSSKSRNVSGRSKYPYLSTSNGHFFLPRKQSSRTINDQKVNYIKKFIYTLISITCILTIGFIMGFVLATTKELTNVSIKGFENPIVSQDELLFNIVVEAFNPGWFSVDVDEVELDIFAKSGYLPESMDIEGFDLQDLEKRNSVETVLLGTITNLESPMTFSGGFFSRELIQQSGEIKLLRPGRNLTSLEFERPENDSVPDNSDKWEIIAKNPFDLIVRGILKYNLPMSKNSKSVVVSKVGYIDPNQDNLNFK